LQGLVKQDGYEWMIREDGGSTVHVGDTVSVWTQFAGVADGRAYLGFDSHDIAPAHASLSTGGTLAVVMAANTNQLIIQKDAGSNGVASFTNVATTPQTYQADHWYRLEAQWGAGGAITANLYDSDGTTLLSTVSGTTTAPFASGGGIAFRALGHDKYFDSVVVDTGSTGSVDERANAGGGLDPSWVAGDPPAPVGNGPSGNPAPVPWAYTSTPGSGIEVRLDAFNGLQQFAIVGGTVGLAAGNLSFIAGTNQVGWGDPIETPLLAQYVFRQRPGEATQLIGASSVKHFFSSAHFDSQHLNPGESDAYGAGLNASQSLYTYGSELDPVTGTLHSPIDRIGTTGSVSVDGIVNNGNRTFSSPIDLLLQVSVADLDPAQNPAGTTWYLMGNAFVGGEQDVTQASRWVEIVPHLSGTTFSFTYPSGNGGHLDFRTIPGLVAAGFVVTSSSPSGNVIGPVDHVHVAFNQSVDVTTFTPAQVNFVDPNGSPITITSITDIGSPDHTQFDINFATQGSAGNYALTLSSDIQDLAGDSLATYTTGFTITSPAVIATTPGAGTVAAPFNQVRVTFDRPMDPGTVTSANITLTGPGGDIPLTIAPAGPDNTQFDVTFADQTAAGAYTLAISNGVQNTFANPITPFTRQFNIVTTGSNLVTNGDFETGSFSGWTQWGDTGFTAVAGSFAGTAPHGGSYQAYFGPTGGLGGIYQDLNTATGTSYTLSFWLAHPFTSTGTEWTVSVGGTTLMDVHDDGNFGYTQFTFTFTATSASTRLQFGFLEPPSYFFLDDVSVIAT
jgi:hypothetical protein